MDRREAKRRAYRVAYELLDSAMRDGGNLQEALGYDGMPSDDRARMDVALDDVAQMLFERGTPHEQGSER